MYASYSAIESSRCRLRLGPYASPTLLPLKRFGTISRPTMGPPFRSTKPLPMIRTGSPALDRDLVELGRRFDLGTDSTVLDWEYLLFTARKSG